VSTTESPSGRVPGPLDVDVERLESTLALLIPRAGLDGEQLERALHLTIGNLVAEGVTGLVLDLRAYAVLDSSGLGALVASHGDVAETSGARLVLTGVAQSLHRTLSRSMLLQVLPVYETVERASAALRA
jgi:anti-anti-sigma factor